MKSIRLWSILWLLLFLCACSTSEVRPSATPLAGTAVLPSTTPELSEPDAGSQPSPVPSLEEVRAFSTVVMEVEPTPPPRPDDGSIPIPSLPLGQPGQHVNVTLGYWVQYPKDWYTGFGNQPLLVSFSNLNPGEYNRDSLRVEGCLIEISVTANVFGFTPEMLRAQMPRSFPNAEEYDLDGESALLVRRDASREPFDSVWLYVVHGDRLFVISLEYSWEDAESSRAAWERMLSTWRWFTPSMAVYSNTSYDYAISYPREWYISNRRPEGISISQSAPGNVIDANLVQKSMVVTTDVLENPENLSLNDWLAEQDLSVDWMSEVPLGRLRGLRIIRSGPIPGIQTMEGFFLGPLGRIYSVTCLYPEDRQWSHRPVANAIIHSFSF